MKVYAAIKIGRGKNENGKVCDDRILVGKNVLEDGYYEYQTEDTLAVAVSDGVGGTGCGWKAATVALETLAQLDLESIEDEYDLEEAFLVMDAAVRQVSQTDNECKGTAATLSALIVHAGQVGLLHVGDSRVYQKRTVQGHTIFKQLTEDHNNLRRWRLEEEERGRTFSEAEMKEAYGWNHITSYVGMKSSDDFQKNMCVEESVLAEGMFVLTSDGIHDFIDKKTFRKLLEEDASWDEKLKRIMEIAREHGSLDDQSIIVLELE